MENFGYVKENSITNKTTIREDMTDKKQIEGKVSMVWDYIYEYSPAPKRTEKIKGVNVVAPTFFTLEKLGKGKMIENVGESGKAYIEWAHSNGYKVWPTVSNSSMIETTSEIMRDYKLRHELIEKIVSLVVKYNLDGINIDFENMYADDKALFSRFIIELSPRLKEIGAVLSVDVTAPDGSETWSMCYNRHVISNVADYIVFMAYDQYGESSTTAGTTAGCNWVEANISKFLGQEGVEADKIVLGMPFYTREWRIQNGTAKSVAYGMNKLDKLIPSNAKKTWDEGLKQYVAEYTREGIERKVWMEEENSFTAKISLIEKYNLAGAGYWSKDMESDYVWDIASEKLGIN